MTVRREDPDELAPLDDDPVGGPVADEPSLAVRGLRRVRRLHRPRWWEEVLFIGISYALYSTVRNSAPSHSVAAFHRAHSILRFETRLHIDAERPLNRLVASSPALAYVCAYWYAVLHFIVTIGVLVWVYVRHPLRYRPIRSVLYTTNLLALLGFWFYALAPPRLLPTFVDTVDKWGPVWVSWNNAGVAKVSNQLAAMPSLHIGWSTWCGITIFRLATRRWVRVLGLCYPLLTLFVILGTANHFTLDAVGGLCVLTVSFLIERVVYGRGPYDSPSRVRRAFAWHS